ncbi:hypothetical protein FRB90_002818 [Tulasnella sp. 427]|nr:hypothetical protein FRB90_002818 [Tulasnella sp. 427]
MMSLFKSTAGTASNKEQQPGVHEALRAEARRIREAEAKNTFDLMASSEKIRAFEVGFALISKDLCLISFGILLQSCLEGMGVWPLPQVLLHPLSTTGHSQNAPPNASQQQQSQ